jgi:hypothetical protein
MKLRLFLPLIQLVISALSFSQSETPCKGDRVSAASSLPADSRASSIC